MGKDLHLDSAAQGLAGGIFFIGYLVLQIPGGHLAERWSAKKFVGIMILIWGVFAFLSAFVQNYTQLLVVRFLLGVAEGGIWPAILVLISHWFPARERARAYGFWMMNIAISSIISAPLSGALAYDGPFWASSSRAVPVALAGGAMGLINALGNLGGFAGPYIGGWLQDASGGSFLSTAVVLAIALVLGGLVMLTLRRHADKPTVAPPAAAPAAGGAPSGTASPPRR